MIDMILSRRSCRSYTEKKVSEDNLQTIVKCGVYAPSGMNSQGIQFCVITNEEILNALETKMERSFFYHAPALIVAYCASDYKYAQQDGSCAMTQMYLAAHALGLGCCWINQMKDMVDDPKFADLYQQLGLYHQCIVGALAVGYAKDEPKERIIHDNRVRFIK